MDRGLGVELVTVKNVDIVQLQTVQAPLDRIENVLKSSMSI